MKYPANVRTNMRYRGPKESRKVNQDEAQTRANLALLKQRLTEQKEQTNTLYTTLYTGNDHLIGEHMMGQEIKNLQDRLAHAKGGLI